MEEMREVQQRGDGRNAAAKEQLASSEEMREVQRQSRRS